MRMILSIQLSIEFGLSALVGHVYMFKAVRPRGDDGQYRFVISW